MLRPLNRFTSYFVALLLSVHFFSGPSRAGFDDQEAEKVTPAARDTDAIDWSGHWEGIIRDRDPSTEVNLAAGVQVEIATRDGHWSGTVSVPSWGEDRWPLTDFDVRQADTPFRALGVSFRLREAPVGEGVFQGVATRREIMGTYAWDGRQYPLYLTRDKVDAAHLPPQRQLPREPLPYSVEDVSFRSGIVTIGGKLTLPERPTGSPAVLLLYGSGAQRCDAEIPGRPSPDPWQWIVADRLTRSGIAVLRVDDRGVGGSTGHYDQSTLAELADDAVAGVEFLRRRKAIRGRPVGIVGFSEGGMVASLAASKSKSVAFLGLLATPGLPADVVLSDRLRQEYRRRLADEGLEGAEQFTRTFEARRALRERMYEILKGDKSTPQVQQELDQMWAEAADRKLFPTHFAQFVEESTRPIFRSTLRYDPAPALRAITVPVVALAGGDDEKVDLGHSFQKTQREAGETQLVDDAMLDTLTRWVKNRASGADPGDGGRARTPVR